MSTTLQQIIFNALHKAATPDGETPVFATSGEARDAYIALVMAELFPGAPVAAKPKTKKSKKATAESPVVATPMEVVVPEVAPVEAAPVEAAPVKVKSPKTKSKKAAEKAAEAPLPESPAAVAAPAESPKKKRAPMTEEAKAAMKAKREATLAAKKQVDELATALGELTIASEPNLKVLNPTWKRHLKTAAKAQKKEVTKEVEADYLSYLNGITKEEFNAKGWEEHPLDFLAPQTASNAVAPEIVPTDLDIVEFNGQDYFVNPKTKRVYEGVGARDDDTGAYENYEGRGWVGMAEFEGMTLE